MDMAALENTTAVWAALLLPASIVAAAALALTGRRNAAAGLVAGATLTCAALVATSFLAFLAQTSNDGE